MDVYDRVQAEDLMKNAVIVAAFAYHAPTGRTCCAQGVAKRGVRSHSLVGAGSREPYGTCRSRRCDCRRAGGRHDVRRDAQSGRQADGRGASAWNRRAGRDKAGQQVAAAGAERERQATGATKDLLDKAERQLREAFQALAAEALHANQGAFLDLAKATFDGLKNETAAQMDARHKAIDTLVKPLADSLKAVELRLGETERTRIDSYARLTEQLASLGTTTQTLARALRTPSVRGRWGEMQLRRVVELSGMLQHCDFEEQPALWSDTPAAADLMRHLPGGKQMVVDASASRTSSTHTRRRTSGSDARPPSARPPCARHRQAAPRATGTARRLAGMVVCSPRLTPSRGLAHAVAHEHGLERPALPPHHAHRPLTTVAIFARRLATLR